MSKENNHGVPFRRYLISLACVAIISGGATYTLTEIYHEREEAQAEDKYPHAVDLEKINATYERIVSSYIGEYDKNELIDEAIKGMTIALDDPYSEYFSGADTEDLEEMIEGSFEGIGAVMTGADDVIKIAEPPIKDSPAEKAMLQADDLILKVDGKSIAGQNLNEVVKLIRGEKGTEVILTVKRADETFDVTLTRDTIPIETVFAELDKTDKKVGKIRISNFSRQTTQDFYTSVKKLREDGATSFIIDLRQNPGGMMQQVQMMASMFLKDGDVIVKFEEKDKVIHEVVASKELDAGFKIKEPTVVLVNENSASAAEIMAAALNQSAGIDVVGTTTFGKGTIQTVETLTGKSDLKLTTGKWLTPNGDWVNEKGFKPTVEVEFPAYYHSIPIDLSTTFDTKSTGAGVKNINLILSGLDYQTDANSDKYTEATEAAVKEFQRSKEIEETGVVNEETAVALQVALIEKTRDNQDIAYEKGLEVLKGK